MARRTSRAKNKEGVKMTELVKYEQMGLAFPKELTWEEAEQVAHTLFRMQGALAWWVGDFLNFSEGKWGEEYAQLVPEGYKPKTFTSWQWVASKIPAENRRLKLSWSHHQAVAKLEPEDREKFLSLAIENNWSLRELRENVRPKDPKPAKIMECPECGHKWEM